MKSLAAIIILLLATAARADVASLMINGDPIIISLAVPMPTGALAASHTRTLVDHYDSGSITGGQHYPFGFNDYGWVYSGTFAPTGIPAAPWSFELQECGWGWLINLDGKEHAGYTPIGTVTPAPIIYAILNSPLVDAWDFNHAVPEGPNGFYVQDGIQIVDSPASVSVPEPATLTVLIPALLFLRRKA